jgi:hypothetical protein
LRSVLSFVIVFGPSKLASSSHTRRLPKLSGSVLPSAMRMNGYPELSASVL